MSLIGFPLLVISFLIYNVVAFLFPGVSWTSDVAHIQMMSGAGFTFTPGDLLIAISVLILFVEVLKATRFTARTMIDHTLSMILFIVLLVEFLMVKQAATGTFFLLLIISFVDVIGGFSVTISTARRQLQVEDVKGATA
jgi:hypothetical protein